MTSSGARFGNDWWPAEVARPRLRLLAAMIASPVLVAVVATAVAFLVAGMTLTEKDAVIDQTVFVGLTVLGALLAFSGSFGLIAVLILWATRRRSAIAFLVAGVEQPAAHPLDKPPVLGVAAIASIRCLRSSSPSAPSAGVRIAINPSY